MERILNFGFAKISVFLTFLLVAIYFIRITNIRFYNNKNKILIFLNRILRKYHKIIGILLVITGLAHGIFSSKPILSFNFGTLAWIMTVILGFNWMFRKKFKRTGWIYYHRIFTIIYLILLAIHVLIWR